MLAVRTIPTLLLDGLGLVKGQNFKDHKYVGDPVNAVKIFNDKEVDELTILDISARQKRGGPNFELISDIASQAFMPFGYGGGLDTPDQATRILRLGAEKIVLNTSAVGQSALVKQISDTVGSQSVVVSIDVKKSRRGKHQVHVESGTKNTKLDPVEVATAAQDAGAGEILLTSIDNEGTGNGFDSDLITRVTQAVDVPVVASGGAAKVADFRQAVTAGASACAAGDMFTFRGRFKAVLITYPSYEELENAYSGIVSSA